MRYAVYKDRCKGEVHIKDLRDEEDYYIEEEVFSEAEMYIDFLYETVNDKKHIVSFEDDCTIIYASMYDNRSIDFENVSYVFNPMDKTDNVITINTVGIEGLTVWKNTKLNLPEIMAVQEFHIGSFSEATELNIGSHDLYIYKMLHTYIFGSNNYKFYSERFSLPVAQPNVSCHVCAFDFVPDIHKIQIGTEYMEEAHLNVNKAEIIALEAHLTINRVYIEHRDSEIPYIGISYFTKVNELYYNGVRLEYNEVYNDGAYDISTGAVVRVDRYVEFIEKMLKVEDF